MQDMQREETLGKPYDIALLQRLWPYVRPYRRQFFAALICLPITSGFLLAQPYILKLAIDRYIRQHDAHGLARAGVLYAVALIGEVFLAAVAPQFLGARTALTVFIWGCAMSWLPASLLGSVARTR